MKIIKHGIKWFSKDYIICPECGSSKDIRTKMLYNSNRKYLMYILHCICKECLCEFEYRKTDPETKGDKYFEDDKKCEDKFNSISKMKF